MIGIGIGLGLLGTPPAAAAESDWSWVTQNTVAVSSFRSGLQVQSNIGRRLSLWEQEGNILRQNTGVEGTAAIVASPAHTRLGAQVTVSPLAIFDLHLYAGGVSYFGNFQTVVGYPDSSTAVGSNAAIAEWVDTTNNQAPGLGMILGTKGVVKLQVGPVVGLLSTELTHWRVSSDVDGPWFFEREKEVLLELGGDEILDVNGLVLAELEVGSLDWIRVGSLTTWRYGIGAQDSLLRSGALVSIGKGPTRHNLIVQPYLSSRNFGPSDLPYVAYAFQYIR